MKKMKLFFTAMMVLMTSVSLFAQDVTVTGVVRDASTGEPVPFASIQIKGTLTGGSTDADGNYEILVSDDAVLVFTSIGYQAQEIAVDGRPQINVALEPDSEMLDETIVVAFGTTTKEAFTGSAKVLKSDELLKNQTTNVSEALVGKVAGVQFASASGRPGSTQTMYVRGYGSVNAGNSPLWVVDGVPYEGDINNINTADIESISVLKDAASNALYGARGANGVIMVTTKRAKSGEAKVTFDAKWGMNNKALRPYDIIDNAGEFYEMAYMALYNNYTINQGMTANDAYMAANSLLTSNNAGGVGYNVYTVPDGQTLIGSNGRLNPNATLGRKVTYNGQEYLLYPDNWMDEIYKNSFRQEYNVNVAGATEKSNFYASLGYLGNDGIIAGSSNSRLTARLRGDYQAKKWLKVGANMSYTHFVWNNGNDINSEGASDGGNAFATAYMMAPIYPVYIRDGNGNIMKDEYGMNLYDSGDGRNGGALRTNGGQSNDLQDIQLNKYINEGNAFSANGFVDIDIYKGLKLTVNGSVTLDETRGTTMLNPYYGQFAESGGVITKEHGREISYNLQQLLTYTKTFNDVHHMDLLAGHEMYNRKSYGLYATRSGMFSYDNLELSGAVVDNSSSGSSLAEYNNEGYFFRGQYDYDSRVYFSASYRRDASSRFHPDHRWGNFWSVGAAWIISDESWFNAPWMNMLKLKASYGSQGNDNISDYLYVDYYSISNDGSGGITTVFERKGNPEITWETNSNFNVGVEFGFWNDRLYGNIDFFNRKTSDMLFSLPVPSEAGYNSYYTNIGDMANRGVEIELNADIIRTKDLLWSFNLNMTHYRNKLLRLPDEYKTNTTSDGTMTGLLDGNYFRSEGETFFNFYLPTYAGVDQSTGQSMWYVYRENEESGELERVTTTSYSEASSNGREIQGDAIPDLYGGFGTSLSWKGLDFSVNFTYQLGGQVYDSGYAFFMGSPTGTSTGSTYHRDLWNSWTPENTNTDIPRMSYGDSYSNGASDRFLTSASYLNFQNVTLGYTLPSRITRKFLVESLRIYATCENVWYWSARQGLDPRQSISGTTNPFYYAPVRTISGGITLTF